MTNDFFRNRPTYNDDADYTTNANSFYHYLGKINHNMKLLINNFVELQEKNEATIAQFNDRLNGIKEEMKDFFNLWLADGTLEQIINQDILNQKADKTELDTFKTNMATTIAFLEETVQTNTQDIDALEQKHTQLLEKISNLETEINSLRLTIEKKLLYYPINVKDFGVKGDGKTDDSITIQQANDQATSEGRSLYFPDGVYMIHEVVITTSMELSKQTAFHFNGTPSEKMLWIETNGKKFGDLTLNGLNKDCTLLAIKGNNNLFNTIDIRNIVLSKETPRHCFGVMIAGDGNTIHTITGGNLVNGEYVNESFPQAVMTEQGDNYIKNILLKDITSGLVTSGKTTTYVDSLKVINGSDNGIYNLSDASLRLGNFFYDGSEESGVFTGDNVYIDSYHVRGAGSRIGFQNIKNIRINHLHVEADDNGMTPNSLFRTRTSNVESGIISLGLITGELVIQKPGTQMCLVENGAVKYFQIDQINLTVIFKNEFSSLERFALFNACEQFKLNDINLRIVDLENKMTSSDMITMALGTPIKKSYIDGVRVELVQGDGTTPALCGFRVSDIKKPNTRASNMPIQANIGPYGRDLNYSEINTVNLNPGTTSKGYWRQGEVLWNSNIKDTGSVGWICYESGEPGLWREINQ